MIWAGSFPRSDEVCARDDTPPERLIPFVNASDSALTVCSSMRRHCHHQQIVFCGGHCFPDWPLFFQAGHRFPRLFYEQTQLFKKASQLFIRACSTVYGRSVNCLRTIIQLFMKSCSIVYQSSFQCSPTLGQLFPNGDPSVYGRSVN